MLGALQQGMSLVEGDQDVLGRQPQVTETGKDQVLEVSEAIKGGLARLAPYDLPEALAVGSDSLSVIPLRPCPMW